MDSTKEQMIICKKYGTDFIEAAPYLKVGIAENVKTLLIPINGLRIPLKGDTTGWYIWAGEEFSSDPDFFVPLHIEHLGEWCPQIIKFLGLPPGWRFLIADNYEDVWQDLGLLNSDSLSS